ncbi:SDR family NAD(P)-dependent oxidoreductase [Brucella sp. BE17]|uniref:SDR family oxidoreductase n=1 Tax=Brucella sp. BE17 TaxID=3142977 RepID=UPI0031BAAA47
MNLTGNTILVTGGTSGIGRALASQFHQRGNRVIITGRREGLLNEITTEHPGMIGIRLDVEDPENIAALASHIRETFPDLNTLINNAGITKTQDLVSGSADISLSEAIIRTNITGVLHITAALLPVLQSQQAATIITTTSGLAFVPLANYPTYCASKAFLHSWLQSLRTQLRATSVEVLELAPPYVQTELHGPEQASDPHAMPLTEYIAEVMDLIGAGYPENGEILVERVKMLRMAEASRDYQHVYAMLNGA